MAKRSKEDALETRERILDAAIAVFYEHGVARPSLSAIAKLAGVTRGAVYGHFRNKADLFNALCERVRLPAETLGERDPVSLDDPLGELQKRCQSLLHTVAQNPQWQQIFAIIFHRCEQVTESGEIRERMLAARAEGDARIATLLDKAVARGQLPADLDIPVAAGLLHNALTGLLQDWVLRPHSFDLPTTGMRYVDGILEMLQTTRTMRCV
ncbi:TetR family transcriptional regulator [Marinobacter sp. X15-166B]|uniref:TetR family transcriptional regulator n=1 Tax=Marinobacter sp. X15-166B TaxID=1897620 RepID=UPI00085C4E6D|nr:TetR family transcriptional regulator [Marinobacter sp. X15-166B]OEY65796.1 hypothetical protein BG841_04550 [Marinobacter sp. X15-166B]